MAGDERAQNLGEILKELIAILNEEVSIYHFPIIQCNQLEQPL